jgi:hypothetical protein
MIGEHMSNAAAALSEALTEYEGNGTRYEPADREELIDLIMQVDELRRRLTLYMAELPFLDHHPIGEAVVETSPHSIPEIFEELEDARFISPDGPLKHHVAFQQLKDLFQNTTFSLVEAYHLLHRVRSA